MDICTIIAANYAPFARVLAESFAEHHPESRCFVLVIDGADGFVDPAQEPFELLEPGDLGIENFARMAALYSVLELSTAVKPWLLRHLLNVRGCETLAYLDPDIQVFDRLDEIDALLHEHRLVVTPHLTAPMPRDGHKPSETDILIAGSYNLGFIGLAPGSDTDELLDWWAERLKTDCVVAPDRGFFVDQRWMDFAPGLVPSFHVLRDPGYNVAYWNLPSREIAHRDGRWTANGRPLRFFHFSGFDPHQPHLLSKHQDRIQLSEHPALRELCERYAEMLLARPLARADAWSYKYDRLPDGTPIDPAVRLAFRRALEAGALRHSPFTAAGARELLDWMAAAPGGERAPSRYLLALYDTRPDLRAAFPDLAGEDGARYVSWAQTLGRVEVPIPLALVPGWSSRNGEGAAAHTAGVNVAGYFGSILGVGEAARQVVAALEAGGTPVSIHNLVPARSLQDNGLRPARSGGAGHHPINLICVNADALPAFADEVGPAFFKARYSIGLWWWEVSQFPERWLDAFNHVDEVWAGSRFVADALSQVSPVPVVHITQPVLIEEPPAIDRATLGLPEGFVFLFSFDYESVFARKNPLAIVEAFSAAFEPGSGAALVVKSINHEYDERSHERLRIAASRHPDVHLVDRYVSRAERDALTAACDCYVSLHRSEGFGFTVAEAMALARPVITTAYSGTMDFTTPENSYLVDYELVPIGPGADPYPAQGEWAAPDVEHAARLMRHVFEHPDEARERGQRAQADIRSRHSRERAGARMRERLARAAIGFAPAPRAHRQPGTFDPDHLRERVSHGPLTPRSSRFGAPQRAARKALLRALKPYTAYERSVDAELIRSLEAVDRGAQAMALPLNDRIDDLVNQVEALASELREQIAELRVDSGLTMRFISSFGLPDAEYRRQALQLAGWPEAPERPWTADYVERHREFVTRALDDPSLRLALKTGRPLPSGYGIGFDERVVEFPWTVTRDLTGVVLDAGSTLNHPHILIRVRPLVEELHIVTLAPEQQAYPFLDVSYLYSDLRELPVQDATYDRVVSISTLEHVGMDNEQYGDHSPRSADARVDLAAAMAELRRVLKPGGRLFITVPYGEPADLGWQRIFDADGIAEIVAAFGSRPERAEYFRYSERGWQRSPVLDAAGAVYRDHFATPEPAADRAVAARAIACLQFRR
jgi:glycosyltransferase involved in cell wall biosynthesis/SAM-dependent methyltransferase